MCVPVCLPRPAELPCEHVDARNGAVREIPLICDRLTSASALGDCRAYAPDVAPSPPFASLLASRVPPVARKPAWRRTHLNSLLHFGAPGNVIEHIFTLPSHTACCVPPVASSQFGGGRTCVDAAPYKKSVSLSRLGSKMHHTIAKSIANVLQDTPLLACRMPG